MCQWVNTYSKALVRLNSPALWSRRRIRRDEYLRKMSQPRRRDIMRDAGSPVVRSSGPRHRHYRIAE